MELINNLSFVEAGAAELIGPKSCGYNNFDIWKQVANYPNFKCDMLEIPTRDQRFPFHLYYVSHKAQNYPCIVYLHGLSSFALEGLYLLPFLQQRFSLCLYDLSGHGKNKNNQVTYGIQQAIDLYFVIDKLKSIGIQQIYLWGRSMGASTILNFLKIYGEDPLIKQIVKFSILDSPFVSFEQIAKQTVAKKLGLPAFICSPLVNAAINKVTQKYKIDLKSLNFYNLNKIQCPATFVYSQNDQIVDFSHSASIIKQYGGPYFSIKSNFSHNQPRSINILKQVFNSFKKEQRVYQNIYKQVQSKKGLSISLISNKNIPQIQKQIPNNQMQENRKQLASNICISIEDKQNRHEGIAIAIKRNLMNNKGKLQTSKQLTLERSKPKYKITDKGNVLTNKHYM